MIHVSIHPFPYASPGPGPGGQQISRETFLSPATPPPLLLGNTANSIIKFCQKFILTMSAQITLLYYLKNRELNLAITFLCNYVYVVNGKGNSKLLFC